MFGILIVAAILLVYGIVEVVGNCYDPAWYRKMSDLIAGSYERHLLGEKVVRSMGFVSGGLAMAIGMALFTSVILHLPVGNLIVGGFSLVVALIFAQIIYVMSGASLFPAPRTRVASRYRRPKR